MSSNDKQDQQGLLSGHAQYVKGVAVEGIGSVTGSQDWKASGEQAKSEATSAMKRAGEQRDHPNQGFGKVEEVAGRAVGCEGMEKEGEASKKQ